MIERGIGAGRRSAEAEERLRGSHAAVPVERPDFDDHAAVATWRAAVNGSWGEENDSDRPHRPLEVGGVACLRAGDQPSDDQRTIVYVHGGGYCLGSAGVAIPITARLAQRATVVSVDYRLAPEHPCPAAIDDVVAVCGAVSDSGSFALAGDSAGAGIALAATCRLRDEGHARPAALALFSPHLDHSAPRGGGDEAAELAALSAAYVGAVGPSDPQASPLHGDLSDMPPTLIQVAAGERLLGQAAALSRRLKAQRTPCVLDVWEGMWHTWQYHRLPEADRALREAVDFLLGVGPLS